MNAPEKIAPVSPLREWLDRHSQGRWGHFIEGGWTERGEAQFQTFDPARPSIALQSFALGTAADVECAVASAHGAFASWAAMPGPERGEILFRAARGLEEQVDALAYAISAEQGKVLSESRGEVVRAARELRFCAGEASRAAGVTMPSEKRGALAMSLRVPIGVVAAITPWNFPIVAPVRKIGPALAAGCTVVLKASNLTPWAACLLMDVFAKAGVPAGVLNLVNGTGAVVGEALVSHPLVRGISFTGSSPLGKRIAASACARLARVQLELGGKNPAVVLHPRDIDATARQIVGAAFACSGQRCTAISRVIVTEAHADQLLDALGRQMGALVLGASDAEGAQVGPLITAAHLCSVQGFVERAIAEGARRVSVETRVPAEGHYMAPVLLDGVTPAMEVAREEVFGPVLAVLRVRDAQEALAVANDCAYGLASVVFTTDTAEALAFVHGAAAGMVHVNHGTASEAHLPFGGVRDSGLGPYSIGATNLDFFCDLKVAYLAG